MRSHGRMLGLDTSKSFYGGCVADRRSMERLDSLRVKETVRLIVPLSLRHLTGPS